jgi:uncharacterized YigZ family protein
MNLQNYMTVRFFGSDSVEIKRSKFIGYAQPVRTQEEAVAFIDEIRRKHRDARHNCYAYVLRDCQQKRYSDDGEPQGTAGMPILDVILKSELTDVCVVVTRYFGGILLGTGGLVRAYTEASQLALQKATPVMMTRCHLVSTTIDYSLYGMVENLMREYETIEQGTDFADSVTLNFAIDKTKFNSFAEAFTDIVAGKVSLNIIGTKYIAI